MIADPKPEKRIEATRKQWDELRAKFAHACCVSCGLGAQHLHHIAFRKADSGDDAVENLAPMCNSCHDKFHRHSPGWERIGRAVRFYVYADPNRLLYAIRKLGEEKFNRRYPGALKCSGNPDCLLADGHGGTHAFSLTDDRFWSGERFKA